MKVILIFAGLLVTIAVSLLFLVPAQGSAEQDAKLHPLLKILMGTNPISNNSLQEPAFNQTDLGGELTSSPVPITDRNGLLTIFGIGNNKAIYYKSQGSGSSEWTDWKVLNGSFLGSPAVAIDGKGRIVVVARGNNDMMYVANSIQGVNSWSGWKSLNGSFSDSPSIVKDTDGTVFIFSKSPDGSVYYTKQIYNGSDDWSNWTLLGENLKSIPSITIENGTISVVGLGDQETISTISNRTQR